MEGQRRAESTTEREAKAKAREEKRSQMSLLSVSLWTVELLCVAAVDKAKRVCGGHKEGLVGISIPGILIRNFIKLSPFAHADS